MDQVEKDLRRILLVAYLYEMLHVVYPQHATRVLVVLMKRYIKNRAVSVDTLENFKAGRDIINTPYVEYSIKVGLLKNLITHHFKSSK